MKYLKIFEALDKILKLIWKEGILYRGTQETTANSTPCEIQEISQWLFGNFSVVVRQVTYCFFNSMSTLIDYYEKASHLWIYEIL